MAAKNLLLYDIFSHKVDGVVRISSLLPRAQHVLPFMAQPGVSPRAEVEGHQAVFITSPRPDCEAKTAVPGTEEFQSISPESNAHLVSVHPFCGVWVACPDPSGSTARPT